MKSQLRTTFVLGVGLMMSGCSLNPGGSLLASGVVVSEKIPVSKQRQKIAFLQKKLTNAEKEQKKIEEEVDRLSQELHSAQLALINKQVDGFEHDIKRLKEDPKQSAFFLSPEGRNLFLKERDLLQQMMENGSPPAAYEAQVVLDRILRMITMLTDDRDDAID